jgi:hypothetical protein
MIGIPISTVFSKPVITPEENAFHPKPTMGTAWFSGFGNLRSFGFD